MKLFTCTNFTGHWPVGTAAIILAESIEDALPLFHGYLAGIGLAQPFKDLVFTEVDQSKAQVIILCDGSY